jgi:hypothetical protein
MKKSTLIMAALILLPLIPYACYNPADQWAAGVVWTNNETTDFSVIETLGEEGRHYLKEGNNDTVKYTFRSHYAPVTAMVYLGFYTMSYQPQAAPRMAIVLDSNQDKDSFDFAAAVRAELDWLEDAGIVDMSLDERKRAEDSLAAVASGNAQYWTHQQKVLSYNSFFMYDTATGAWSVDGVNTYRGCGLDVGFGLPPEELSTISIETGNAWNKSLPSLSAFPNPCNAFTKISFYLNTNASVMLQIYDISGKLVKDLTDTRKFLQKGHHSIKWNATVPNGLYYIRLEIGQKILTQSLLFMK